MNNDNGSLYYSVSLNIEELKRGAEQSMAYLRKIGATAEQEGNAMDATFKKLSVAAAGVFAADKIKDFTLGVAKVRGEFQKLEIAFSTMLGSQEKANALMSQLTETAAITPFGMSDVANGAKQLLAYGLEADKVNETLIRLGDIAAGLSIPLNDLAYLYGTTMVQGRMYTQDLNQFLGRGIPIMDELAAQFGVAKEKVKDLVTEGKVGFPEVEKAIISLTDEGSKFGGLMEAQSKTITGQWSNIEDSIEQMKNELGKASEGAINTTLDVLSSVVEHWRDIANALAVVLAGYGTYKAVTMAVATVTKLHAALQAEAALQMRLAAAQGIALSYAEAMAAARTQLLTGAMNGLKVAFMANPWGFILGAIASIATAIGVFSSKTDKLTQMSEKFGESAAKQLDRINNLTLLMKGLTAGTATHKKAIEELNGILEEYGVAQIKEGDNIDAINAKRELAIELIKQEAIERQRANSIDTAMETYFTGLKEAQDELRAGLQEAQYYDDYVEMFFDLDEVQGNANAISDIIANHVQENLSLIANKTGDEYQEGLNKLYDGLQKKMREIGLSEETIAAVWRDDDFINPDDIIGDYIAKLKELKEAEEGTINTTNKLADAEKKAAEGKSTMAERMEATQKALRGASDDTNELYENIRKLMSKYSENTIGFKIKFDAEVPAWMDKIELPELKRLAGYFTSLGNELLKSGKAGANINGQWRSTEEIVNQGMAYSNAAKDREETEAANKGQGTKEYYERKKKEATAKYNALTEAELKTKKASKLAEQIAGYDAKIAAWDRKKKTSGGGSGKSADEIAAERQKANLAVTEAEKKAVEERAKALNDIEEQLTTQRLTLMGEGAEKERQQLALNQQKERQQLEEQKNSAVQAEIERQKTIFEAGEEAKKAQNKNYTKQNFTDANIDQAQIDKIKAKYGELATGLADTQQKAQADLERKIAQDELSAMKEYLNEYGSFQGQKLAIAAEYAEKIREVQASSDSEESKARQIKTLKAQQAAAENEVEAKAISAKIDWYTVFGNVGGILKDVLRPLLEELKTYVGTDAFKSLGADQQKAIVDAMSTMRDQIGTNGDLGWRDLARDLTAYQTALQEVKTATDEYKAKQAELTPKIEEARKAIDKATQMKDADGLKAAQEQLTEILNDLAESGAKVTTANKNVTASGQKLAQSSKDVTQPIDSIHNFLQGTGLSELQTVWDSLLQIKGAADGLKALKDIGKDVQDLGKDLGDAGKDVGDAGKDIGDNLGEALSKGGLITQIVGAVLKICDVLKEGIGTVISSVIDSVTSAVSGILANLLSGDMFKQIGTSLYSGVTGIFDSLIGGLGHIFTGGAVSAKMSDWFTNSNAAEVARTTENLTKRNEYLQQSIEALTESIDDAYGSEALKAYEKAKKDEEEKIANLQTILNEQQRYHSAHKSNAHYWDMSDADTAAVNKLLGTSLVGDQWDGWGKLTPEQMAEIRKSLPSVWQAMMEQGKYDKSEYFENYADEAGKLEELTEQINENLTSTTFENLRDDFISNLMDMEKSAEDFANDFSKMMQQALLQAAIGDKFDEKIKAWYEKLSKKMKNEDGTYREMTKDEIDAAREEWNALTAEGIAERDRLLSITGYTGDRSSREATTTGIANASQESVDELNGRATAIQGHTYSINEQTKLLVANTNKILNSVLSIEKHTETIANDVKNVRSAVSDMTTKGVKIKA